MAAKVRELIQFIELHLELVARELYPQAFFGGKVSDETKARVHKLLLRNAKAFGKRTSSFSPFIAGDEFTLADCAAIPHLLLVSLASKAVLGEDVLADLPVREYVKRMSERPTVQRLNQDRKASEVLLKQHYAK